MKRYENYRVDPLLLPVKPKDTGLDMSRKPARSASANQGQHSRNNNNKDNNNNTDTDEADEADFAYDSSSDHDNTECASRILELDREIESSLRQYQRSAKTNELTKEYHRRRNALYSQRKYYKKKYLMNDFRRDKKALEDKNAALRQANKELEGLLGQARDIVGKYERSELQTNYHGSGGTPAHQSASSSIPRLANIPSSSQIPVDFAAHQLHNHSYMQRIPIADFASDVGRIQPRIFVAPYPMQPIHTTVHQDNQAGRDYVTQVVRSAPNVARVNGIGQGQNSAGMLRTVRIPNPANGFAATMALANHVVPGLPAMDYWGYPAPGRYGHATILSPTHPFFGAVAFPPYPYDQHVMTNANSQFEVRNVPPSGDQTVVGPDGLVGSATIEGSFQENATPGTEPPDVRGVTSGVAPISGDTLVAVPDRQSGAVGLTMNCDPPHRYSIRFD